MKNAWKSYFLVSSESSEKYFKNTINIKKCFVCLLYSCFHKTFCWCREKEKNSNEREDLEFCFCSSLHTAGLLSHVYHCLRTIPHSHRGTVTPLHCEMFKGLLCCQTQSSQSKGFISISHFFQWGLHNINIAPSKHNSFVFYWSIYTSIHQEWYITL